MGVHKPLCKDSRSLILHGSAAAVRVNLGSLCVASVATVITRLTCTAVQEGRAIGIHKPLCKDGRSLALLSSAAAVRVPLLCSSLPACLLPAEI